MFNSSDCFCKKESTHSCSLPLWRTCPQEGRKRLDNRTRIGGGWVFFSPVLPWCDKQINILLYYRPSKGSHFFCWGGGGGGGYVYLGTCHYYIIATWNIKIKVKEDDVMFLRSICFAYCLWYTNISQFIPRVALRNTKMPLLPLFPLTLFGSSANPLFGRKNWPSGSSGMFRKGIYAVLAFSAALNIYIYIYSRLFVEALGKQTAEGPHFKIYDFLGVRVLGARLLNISGPHSKIGFRLSFCVIVIRLSFFGSNDCLFKTSWKI